MVEVDEERCMGCGACIDACSFGAISMVNGKARIEQENCRSCMICARYCGEGAIVLKKSEEDIMEETERKLRDTAEELETGKISCRSIEELEELMISLKAECYGDKKSFDGQRHPGRSGAGYGSGRGYGRWR
jgi:ferredoxin